jgi:hypothetical protein
MNRNEERSYQQLLNKNKEWFKKLPDSKKRYIGYFIEQKVIKNDNITAAILDDCFKAAMIEVKDLSLSDCNEVIKIANEHMAEVKSVLEKDLKGEYLEMIKDEKLKEEIKKAMIELIKNEIVMSKGVSKLKKIYTSETVKDLTILWAEAKEELKAEKEATTKQQVIQSHVEGELVATLAIEGEHGFEMAPRKITLDKTGIKLNDGFKINKIELEKNGRIYIKDSEGVKLGDKLYKDITDVKHAQEVLESSIKATEDNINKKIMELTKELEETRSKKKQELEKYAEIEQILAM